MVDLEQQCEDALFEVCDARERYPSRCANELQESIKLNNEIHTMKVSFKSNIQFDNQINKELEDKLQHANCAKERKCFEHLDHRLQNVTRKLENLMAVMEIIEKEKTLEINKLLRN